MGDDLAPDWILQQALGVQSAAHRSFVKEKGLSPADESLTLTVLGCGAIGTALLTGLFKAAERKETDQESIGLQASSRVPTSYRACVRSDRSKKRIEKELGRYKSFDNIDIHVDDHIRAIQGSDIAILSCRQDDVPSLLAVEAVKKALSGTMLISVVVGWTCAQLRRLIYGHEQQMPGQCTIVSAAPSITAAFQRSVTVIAKSVPPLAADQARTISHLFEHVGVVEWVTDAEMNAHTALSSSGPALVAVMLESLAAGAVARGVSRENSYRMAAQMMRNTADAVLQGEHPAVLRDTATTAHASRGLAVLEEAAMRGAITKAITTITDAV